MAVVFVMTAWGIASDATAAADVRDVSVRLRPLKNSITVAGTRISVRATSLDSVAPPLLQTHDFDRLTFRFVREKGQDAWIVSDPVTDRKLLTIPGRRADIRGVGLRVDLRSAPPHVQLVAHARSPNLNLVGFLNVEDYLQGVVAGEVPADWPMEALKAQAIAARSFTFARIRERSPLGGDWILESNVTDQVFDFERIHTRASEAVRATRDEVLVTDEDRVVAANYHADCGGKTDEPRAIWGGGLQTGTAVDRGCSTSTRSPWRFVSTISELSARLAERRILPRDFRLASLAVIRRSSAGRALDLRAQATDGRTESFSGEQLREALGYAELKSTLFNVAIGTALSSRQIEFTGRGFGHGTGLCQWGSRQLANTGKTYLEILGHYYPRLHVQKVAGTVSGDGLGHRGVTPGAIASP